MSNGPRCCPRHISKQQAIVRSESESKRADRIEKEKRRVTRLELGSQLQPQYRRHLGLAPCCIFSSYNFAQQPHSGTFLDTQPAHLHGPGLARKHHFRPTLTNTNTASCLRAALRKISHSFFRCQRPTESAQVATHSGSPTCSVRIPCDINTKERLTPTVTVRQWLGVNLLDFLESRTPRHKPSKIPSTTPSRVCRCASKSDRYFVWLVYLTLAIKKAGRCRRRQSSSLHCFSAPR